MDPRAFVSDWRDVVKYSAPQPQPVLLRDAPGFRILIAGLEPGGRIPPHPERSAMYYALEGEGVFTLDDERLPFRAGAIVIAERGTSRGIEAVTRLAFLAVRVGSDLDEEA